MRSQNPAPPQWFAVLLCLVVAAKAQSVVKLTNCSLTVNGKPFTVKGIGYSPALISENGLHADLYGWARGTIHDRDLKLISDLGANTIRLWGLYHLTSSYNRFFNKANSYGLMVMPSFPLNPEVYPDIKSSFAKLQIKEDFTQFVKHHYQSDALLFWLIGNEPNKDRVNGGYQDQLLSFISLFNDLLDILKEIEGENRHPACAPLADQEFLDIVGQYDLPGPNQYKGDMWCVQPYRGDTFDNENGDGDLFTKYPRNQSRPLLLTEFGADSWDNVRNIDNQEDQATTLMNQHRVIEEHLMQSNLTGRECYEKGSLRFLMGATVMEWVDEWWKGKITDMSNMGVCPDPLDSRHRPCGITQNGYKDKHLSEEFLGIVGQDNMLTMWCVIPKLAYYTIGEMYGKPDLPHVGRSCVMILPPAVAGSLVLMFFIALGALVCHIRAWRATVRLGIKKRKDMFQKKNESKGPLDVDALQAKKDVMCVRTCPRQKEGPGHTQCVYCGSWLHNFCIGLPENAPAPHEYKCPNCRKVIEDDNGQYRVTVDDHSLNHYRGKTPEDLRGDEVIKTAFKDTPHGWSENYKFVLHMSQARDLVDKFIMRERFTRTGQPRYEADDVELTSVEDAITIVHDQMLEGYKTWVKRRSDITAHTLMDDAYPARKRAEVIIWMALRSMSEMVFHCPARLAHLYHICVHSTVQHVWVDLTAFFDYIYNDMNSVKDSSDTRNFDDINRFPIEAVTVETGIKMALDYTVTSDHEGKTFIKRGELDPLELQAPNAIERVDKYFNEPSGFGVFFVILRNAMPLISQKLWAFALVGIAQQKILINKGEGRGFFLTLFAGDGGAAMLSVLVDITMNCARCRGNKVSRAKCPASTIIFVLLDLIYAIMVAISFVFLNTPLGETFWMFGVPIVAAGFRFFYVFWTTIFRMYNLRANGKDTKANLFFRYLFWVVVLGATALFEVNFMLSSMLNLRSEYVCATQCQILDGSCFTKQQTTLCASSLAVTWLLLFSTFLVTNQAFFVLTVAIFGLFTGIRRKLGNVASGSAKFTYNNLRAQLVNFVGEDPSQEVAGAEKTRRMYRVLMENIDNTTEGYVGVVESLPAGEQKGTVSFYVSSLLRIAAQGTKPLFHPYRFQHGCKFREYVRPTTMHNLFSKLSTKAQKDLFTNIIALIRPDILRRLEPGLRELVYAHHVEGHAYASLRQAAKSAIKEGLMTLQRYGDKHNTEAVNVIMSMLKSLFDNVPPHFLPDLMDTMLRQMLHGNIHDLQMAKGTELLTIARFVAMVNKKGLLRQPKTDYPSLLGHIRKHAEGLCEIAEYFVALNIKPPEAAAERLLTQRAYIKLCCARIWEEILNDLWKADRISREERRLLAPRDDIVYQARLKTNDAMEWLAFFVSTLTGIHLSSQFLNKSHITENLLYRRSLTVLIPCYSEQIIYSVDYLREKLPSAMGLANIECLVYTYRYDWLCFSERMLMEGLTWLDSPAELLGAFLNDSYADVGPAATAHELELEVRLWATYRGQTVARTIRGTMGYRRVLRMLCLLQGHPEELVDELYQVVLTHQQFSNARFLQSRPETVPDVDELVKRFDIQVSYDLIIAAAPPDRLKEARELIVRQGVDQFDYYACFDTWKSLSCLRVAWSVELWLEDIGLLTDERLDLFKKHELTTVRDIREAFNPNAQQGKALSQFLTLLNLEDAERQKLFDAGRVLEWKSYLKYALPRKFGVVEMCPGNVRTQGKAGNQRIGLSFISGQVLQALDANQDGSFGEALKMNMLLGKIDDGNKIVGFREDIFTRHEGAVGRFMGYAEFCFGTIFQRVLHSPLGVRLHYGHPDLMDAYWLRSHGVMSKASPNFNLNEDIFAAYDAVLNQERVTHTEWVEFGKGRETNFLGAAGFEAKLAAGAIAQTRSRDVYDLNYRLDGIRQFNLFYGSLGFYLCTLITVFSISLYVLSYVLLSLNLTTRSDLGGLKTNLSGEWLLHIGFMLISPLLVELCLERGVKSGLKTVALDVLLSTLFFVFHLQTKAHFMMQSLTTGKAAYVNTGRPLSMSRHSLVGAYKSFGASHYHAAIVLATLILVYFMASSGLPDGSLPFYTVCMTVFSWLFSPVIFNPFPSAGDCHHELAEMWDWLAHGYVAEYRLAAKTEEALKGAAKSGKLGNVSFSNFYIRHQVKRLSDISDGSGLLSLVLYNVFMILFTVSFVVLCLPPNAFSVLYSLFGLWSVTAGAYMLGPMLFSRCSGKGKDKSGKSKRSLLLSKAQRGPLKFAGKHLVWMVPLVGVIVLNANLPTVGIDPVTILALLLNLAIMNYFQDAVLALCYWLIFRRSDEKDQEWKDMEMHDFFHHIELLFLRRHVAFVIAIFVATMQALLGFVFSIFKNLHTKIVLSADVSQRLAQGASHSLLAHPVSKMAYSGVTLSVERKTKKPTPSSIEKMPDKLAPEERPLLGDKGEGEDEDEEGRPPSVADVPINVNDALAKAFGGNDVDDFQDYDGVAVGGPPAGSINAAQPAATGFNDAPAARAAPPPPGA